MARGRAFDYNAGFEPRHYQRPYMDAMLGGCKFATWVMHRRGGKDRTALSTAALMSMQRVGLYWHTLPTHKQARKVVWDNITSEGRNLIDTVFPREVVAKRIEDEMKVVLKNGSIHQLVGADNFDSLVGANPVHVTFSEWSLTDPRSYDFVRPILRENNGSVGFIYTPRGYNHGWKTLQVAKRLPGAFCGLMTIQDTGVLTEADMALERAQGMAEELIQQEYYCDFSVANLGAILGRYMTAVEREGRITSDTVWTPGSKVVVTSDLGHRDKAAFWWWQLCHGGFELINYDEDTGMDAQDWIERLREPGLPVDRLYLPHDARAKTFATKHSVIEQMSKAYECEIVPQTRISDRINAARMVLPRCRFNATTCADGLEALRNWSFKYNEEQRAFSSEPDHNWASHGSDAFSYGAQMLMAIAPAKKVSPFNHPERGLKQGSHYAFSLEDLWRSQGDDRARAFLE